MTTSTSIKATGTPAQRAQRLSLAAEGAQRRVDRAKAYYKKVRAAYKTVKKEAKILAKEAKRALKEARALKKPAALATLPAPITAPVNASRKKVVPKSRRRTTTPVAKPVVIAPESAPAVALAP